MNKQVSAQYRDEILRISNSGELPEFNNIINPVPPVLPAGNFPCSIELIATDTISAVIQEHRKNPFANIAVLNFASYKHPGGGFMSGAMAQEEALCYCTNLYTALSQCQPWYDSHDKLNAGLYYNQSIITTNLSVIASAPGRLLSPEERFTVTMLTCAAPNWAPGLKYNNITDKQMHEATISRVSYVINILSQLDVHEVMLGAFGCGVFKNDPVLVAQSFMHAIYATPHKFVKAVFAIPDCRSVNYSFFEKTIKSLEQER